MEVTKQILFRALLVAAFLHCVQGMSIHPRETVVVQPTTENCSDTVLVESIIKAYTDKDNATSHRFFHKLLPLFDHQYNFKTVGDLLSHLEQGNNSTLENLTLPSRPIEEVSPLPDKYVNVTSNSHEPRGMRSIEQPRGLFKSSKKKSTSNHDVNNRVNNTAHNKVSDEDSHKTSKSLDGITTSDEEKSYRSIDKKSRYLMKSSKHQTPSGKEMYSSPQGPNSRYDKSHSGVQFSNNLIGPSDKKLPLSLKQEEEPPKICSPKAIIDILRKRLPQPIMNISRGDSTHGSSSKFESESLIHEEHSIHPPRENVISPSTKDSKNKLKHRKSPIIGNDFKRLNKPKSYPLTKDEPSSKKVKHNQDKQKTEKMQFTDKSTKLTSGETLPPVRPFEVTSPRYSPKAIVETLRHRNDPAMYHVSEHITNARSQSLPPSPAMKEHVSVSTHFNKDNPPSLSRSSSLSHRGNGGHGKFKVNPLHEPPVRNISSVDLIGESFTKSLSPSNTRAVHDDLLFKKVTENEHDKNEALNSNAETKNTYFQHRPRDPNEETLPIAVKYIPHASFPFYETGRSLEQSQDGDTESLRGRYHSHLSIKNKDKLDDNKEKHSRESAAKTSQHKTTLGDDQPFHITLPHIVKQAPLYKITSSSRNHNQHTTPPGYLSEEYSEESWNVSVEEMCDGQSEDTFDDWTPSCLNQPSYLEDVGSTPQEEGLYTFPSDNTYAVLDLRYNNDNEDGLNVSRRHTNANYVYPRNPSQSAWPGPCPNLPGSNYFQHHVWPPTVSYVHYPVPPFFCPPCPRLCSDPPPRPRPNTCKPCPQLPCSLKPRPPCSTTPPPCVHKPPPPRKCPPCPASCSEPSPPRPSACKKRPALSCVLVYPPCPRPECCCSCPNVPNYAHCPHCGNEIEIPDAYVCPCCYEPILLVDSDKLSKCRKCSRYHDNSSENNSYDSESDSTSHVETPVDDSDRCSILCPACPDKYIYPNYPPRPKDCKPCPPKPYSDQPAPLPICRPCPELCVPKDFRTRPYGCTKCPCLPSCP